MLEYEGFEVFGPGNESVLLRFLDSRGITYAAILDDNAVAAFGSEMGLTEAPEPADEA